MRSRLVYNNNAYTYGMGVRLHTHEHLHGPAWSPAQHTTTEHKKTSRELKKQPSRGLLFARIVVVVSTHARLHVVSLVKKLQKSWVCSHYLSTISELYNLAINLAILYTKLPELEPSLAM